MLTDVPGIRVGHWTGDGTGVTVIVVPAGSVGSCEVRGGAPATKETALLEPGRTVERVDTIVLTGGSAFGLAAADGVARALAEFGRGFPTRGGPVPIVPAAAIYDLVEASTARPGPEEGRMALADAARRGLGNPFPIGRVGAGTGATIGKWRGGEHAVPGGLGTASGRDGDIVLGAIAVVNAVGDVIAADGTVLAGSTAPPDAPSFPAPAPFEHTTLVAIVTNAKCTKGECRLLSESAHHGMVRSIHPSHTRHDGDVAFAVATGEVEDVQIDRLRVLATEVTAEAVRSAVA
ncbi:MAG TPA: P1 family peptidase [Acidimicrobiia bacterium]|nr:P1 family peptidase [Acidimicrobiia bacterium]